MFRKVGILAALFCSGCMSVSATGLIGGESLASPGSAEGLVLEKAQLLKAAVGRFDDFLYESALARESGMEIMNRLFQNKGVSRHYWGKISEVESADRFGVLLGDVEMATDLLSGVEAAIGEYIEAVMKVVVGKDGGIVGDHASFGRLSGGLEDAVIASRQARRSMYVAVQRLELSTDEDKRLSERVFRFEVGVEKVHRFLRSGQAG